MIYMFLMLVCLVLVFLVTLVFMAMSYKKLLDSEVFSSYECGFIPMSLTRMLFSFRFFLISILFLIFDVEIVLMLPIPYMMMSKMNLISVYLFFSILVMGLLYEYNYGSLNWLVISLSKA